MVPPTQVIKSNDFTKKKYAEQTAISDLYNELAKGIKSLKKGDVYTIDKAWEEIDKI